MLTLEINDRRLSRQIGELLEQRFANDPERMMAELLHRYETHQKWLSDRGDISWPQDGSADHKEIDQWRDETFAGQTVAE